ncbi:hypothetical protein JOC77_002829 [Peribacillus deserti]|uniref:Uncharacterized protein n=1 Tax=Peribacillus deserti TaxID=673318 RepID=A0ABS2QKU8_9BACI|nr:hypothetical protein [Peribacillus deserti]
MKDGYHHLDKHFFKGLKALKILEVKSAAWTVK